MMIQKRPELLRTLETVLASKAGPVFEQNQGRCTANTVFINQLGMLIQANRHEIETIGPCGN